METVFKLNTNQLDSKFLLVIKKLFAGKDVEISIKAAEDETEFLLKNDENRKALIEAINEVKKNKNLFSFTGKEFEKLAKKLGK